MITMHTLMLTLILMIGEEPSYIIQYNFRRMKINNSNKVIGRIYNNFIFTKNGNFIVTVQEKIIKINIMFIHMIDYFT